MIIVDWNHKHYGEQVIGEINDGKNFLYFCKFPDGTGAWWLKGEVARPSRDYMTAFQMASDYLVKMS